jgi:hypothetical protein
LRKGGTASFSDAEQLRDAVTAALRDVELARAVGPVDAAEMLARARDLIPTDRQSGSARLILVVASGPRQEVLRPGQLEAPELAEALMQQALFGQLRILDHTAGTQPSVRGNALVLEQDSASVLLDQLGTVRIIVPIERRRARGAEPGRRGDLRGSGRSPRQGNAAVTDEARRGPRVPSPWMLFLLPAIRAELLFRTILGTRWDDATWAVIRREVPRVLAMRRQAVKDGWWN